MGEFEEFLDPDAGAAQDLDHRGAPEGVVLLAFGVETWPRIAVVADGGEEQRGGPPVAVVPAGASIPGLLHGELLAGRGVPGGVQDESGQPGALLGGGDELGKHRGQGAGALLHPGLAQAGLLDVAADVGLADRARRGPRCPPGRVLQRPLPQIEVEGTHGQQHGVAVQPGSPVGQHVDALLPPLRDVVGQAQRADPGVVTLQVGPEQRDQHLGLVDQGGVVEHRGPLGQVVDQDVADVAVGDVIAVHQLCRGQLSWRARPRQRRRCSCQPAHGVQRLVGQRQRGHRSPTGAAGLGVGGDVGEVEIEHVLPGHDDHSGHQVQRVAGVLVATAVFGQLAVEPAERRGLVVSPVEVVGAEHSTGEQPAVGRADGP